MTDEQIKHMVERFLGWRLPENFNPDGGISFKKAINENRPSWPQKNEPTGTNLFDATQAEAMVRYMVEGMAEPLSAVSPTEHSLRAEIGLERLKVHRLEKWKHAIDIAFTAGMLAMEHESLNGGRKLSAHEFITSLKVAMRQAESEFMRGAVSPEPSAGQEE